MRRELAERLMNQFPDYTRAIYKYKMPPKFDGHKMTKKELEMIQRIADQKWKEMQKKKDKEEKVEKEENEN